MHSLDAVGVDHTGRKLFDDLFDRIARDVKFEAGQLIGPLAVLIAAMPEKGVAKLPLLLR